MKSRFYSPDDPGDGAQVDTPAEVVETPPVAEAPPEAPVAPPVKFPGVKYLPQLGKQFAAEHGEELAEIGADLQSLAQATLDMKRKLTRAIIIPDRENPDAEELKTFREQLGLPEKAEGYKLESKVELPDEVLNAVKTAAFGGGMNNTQAQKFLDFVAGSVATARTVKEQTDKEQREKFDERLTSRFDGDVKKAAAAKNLYVAALNRLSTLVPEDEGFAQRIIDSGLFFDPSFAKVIALTEQHMGDHPFIETGGRAEPPKPKSKGKMGHYSPEFERTYGGT